MAASTNRHELTETWTEIAAGTASDVRVQLQGTDNVLLAVRPTVPSGGTIRAGLMLHAGNPMFLWPTLATGDKIWARAYDKPSAIVVIAA